MKIFIDSDFIKKQTKKPNKTHPKTKNIAMFIFYLPSNKTLLSQNLTLYMFLPSLLMWTVIALNFLSWVFLCFLHSHFCRLFKGLPMG